VLVLVDVVDDSSGAVVAAPAEHAASEQATMSRAAGLTPSCGE
jgi:hypothetical protein